MPFKPRICSQTGRKGKRNRQETGVGGRKGALRASGHQLIERSTTRRRRACCGQSRAHRPGHVAGLQLQLLQRPADTRKQQQRYHHCRQLSPVIDLRLLLADWQESAVSLG